MGRSIIIAYVLSHIISIPSSKAATICNILLDKHNFKDITFKNIPPTTYEWQSNKLVATVKSSSSSIVIPFKDILKLTSIAFEWKSKGTLKIKNTALEKTKSGDDSLFKIGLLYYSKNSSTIPFFAPNWIKMLSTSLHHPTDHMTYLIVGAKNKPGTTWVNPYSDKILNHAVASTSLGQWEHTVIHWKNAQEIVGLWIQADGDNTNSSFISELRNLKLEVTSKSKTCL
ncbi:MAG: DUF3047 domain-containing protein [Bdellovibrionota bacterium]